MTVAACPLCAIVAGSADATVLRCWPDVIAVAAPRPRAPGHLLLIATDHFDDVAAAPHVAGVVMVAAAELAADHPRCDIIATREHARPSDEPRHLHLDLIPRTSPGEFAATGTAESVAVIGGDARISPAPE
ncbi:hypothetical protein [Amycolatopsis sp. NPDC004378]